MTPGLTRKPQTPSLDGVGQSESEELKVVQALLAFKGQPPLPPLSPPVTGDQATQQLSKKQRILKRVSSQVLLTSQALLTFLFAVV